MVLGSACSFSKIMVMWRAWRSHEGPAVSHGEISMEQMTRATGLQAPTADCHVRNVIGKSSSRFSAQSPELDAVRALVLLGICLFALLQGTACTAALCDPFFSHACTAA